MTQLLRDDRRAASASLAHLSPVQRRALPAAFGAFLDAAATATARATFYNTAAEQRRAVDRAHADLFEIERGLYAAALALPGVTDHTRQLGVCNLLARARGAGDGRSVLSELQELDVVRSVCRELPPQRLLKLFGALRERRVNNSRTRKLILRSLLASDRLELWAVKYRRKLARALTHAWGQRTTSVLRSVLAKDGPARDGKEQRIVSRALGRHMPDSARARVEECVRFVLGSETGLTLPRLCAYSGAKVDLGRGGSLPYEVLEGIRGRFHRDVDPRRVLELTRSRLTANQRLSLQRKAERQNVVVEFDPARYDAARLYGYAFEMGLSEAIRHELRRKAQHTAERLGLEFGRVAVIVDASASMSGADTQKRRPMAIALALRDLLAAAADEAVVLTGDGRRAPVTELVEPSGDTSLGAALVAALRSEAEIVFVITDGYENAPAGRFAEVLRAARRLGVDTPIHQLTPVFAAEAGGVRRLCETSVPVLPVSRPESVALGLLRALFEIDVERGAEALLARALPLAARDRQQLAIGAR